MSAPATAAVFNVVVHHDDLTEALDAGNRTPACGRPRGWAIE